jgi:hypothetical protein
VSLVRWSLTRIRGGVGLDGCAALTNHEFERIFYKTLFGFGVTIFNVYMVSNRIF